MLGSVIVEEVGLNVSDLENRARAKPSHPVFLQKKKTFLYLHFFLSPKGNVLLWRILQPKMCATQGSLRFV